MAFLLIAVLNVHKPTHTHEARLTKGFMCHAQRNIKIYTKPNPAFSTFHVQTQSSSTNPSTFYNPIPIPQLACQPLSCLAFTYKIDCENALGTLVLCLHTLSLESS